MSFVGALIEELRALDYADISFVSSHDGEPKNARLHFGRGKTKTTIDEVGDLPESASRLDRQFRTVAAHTHVLKKIINALPLPNK